MICGEVSGGLVCRDFDTMTSHQQWAEQHPDLAKTLPTVATGRGRHVYCLADHRGIGYLTDGELRGAGYCLLPPSRHPDGPEYKWLVPLPEGALPFVKHLEAAGLLDHTPHATERTEKTERTEDDGGQQKRTEAMEGERLVRLAENDFSSLPEDVQTVILETLPLGPGRRNRQVFELARALKSIPRLADAPADALEPCVRC